MDGRFCRYGDVHVHVYYSPMFCVPSSYWLYTEVVLNPVLYKTCYKSYSYMAYNHKIDIVICFLNDDIIHGKESL